MGSVSSSNSENSEQKPRKPRFLLIAELLENGDLVDHTGALSKQLAKKKPEYTGFISVIEYPTPQNQHRVVDFVQFFMENQVHDTSYIQWEVCRNTKHFPRTSDEGLSSELKDRNGILLQVDPYKISKYPKRKVYILCLWIGNPGKMTLFGFGKLRDVLYFTSSFVLHSTNAFSTDQPTNLEEGPALGRLKQFKLVSICFLLFNMSSLKLNHGQTFETWIHINPITAACSRICGKFGESNFCFVQEAAPAHTKDFSSFIQIQLQTFHEELKNPRTSFRSLKEAGCLIAKNTLLMNSLYPTLFPTSNLIGIQVSPTEPQSQDLRDKFTDEIQIQFVSVLTCLVSENPSADAFQLDVFYQLALEKVEMSFQSKCGSMDIKLQVESPWYSFTSCIAELDNQIMNLEAQIMAHVLSEELSQEYVDTEVEKAQKKAAAFATSFSISQYVVQLRSDPFLENIKAIVAALIKIKKYLNQRCTYPSNFDVADFHTKAVTKFNALQTYGNLGLPALNKVLNNFSIENDCRRQQSEILAGEIIQFAIEEYRGAIDQILGKGIYSRNFLIDQHNQLAKVLTDSFKPSNPSKNIVSKISMENLHAQLNAEFLQTIEKNYIKAVAANRRRIEVQTIAYEAFKKSRGADYDQLGRQQKRAHDDARRAALDVFLEHVESEQPWTKKQWSDELFGMIRLEDPSPEVQPVETAPGTSAGSSNIRHNGEWRETNAALIGDISTGFIPAAELAPREIPSVLPATASNEVLMEVGLEHGPARNALQSLIKEMEDILAENTGKTKSVTLRATKFLNGAKQLIQEQDASETQLNLKREQLKVWKDSLMK